MSEYKMEVSGDLELKDYGYINEYILVVDKNDNFTMVLDDISKKHIKIIMAILKENNLNVLEEGEVNNNRYYIKAIKL